MRNFNKWCFIVCAMIALTWSMPASAVTLDDQIGELKQNEQFLARLGGIRALGYSGLQRELDSIVVEAEQDLESASEDLEILRKHLSSLLTLQSTFRQFGSLNDFSQIKGNQYRVNSDCSISDESFGGTHLELDCEEEYRFAVNIIRRTFIAQRIVNHWKKEGRDFGLKLIEESVVRWENFSSKVSSDQFPWETIINGWLIEGEVATPPTSQLRIVHPVALLSLSEEDNRYDTELGLELIGLRTYSSDYDPEYGLSIFALLKSQSSNETGWGVSLSFKNFSFGIVGQEALDGNDDTKILLGYNLASLFDNKKNELAAKKLELLGKMDSYKQKLSNMQNF